VGPGWASYSNPVLHALRHRLGVIVQQGYFRLSDNPGTTPFQDATAIISTDAPPAGYSLRGFSTIYLFNVWLPGWVWDRRDADSRLRLFRLPLARCGNRSIPSQNLPDKYRLPPVQLL
jgi:hypothetical protein